MLASCSTEWGGEKSAVPTPTPLSVQSPTRQDSSSTYSTETQSQADISRPSQTAHTEETLDRFAHSQEAKGAKRGRRDQDANSPPAQRRQVGEASYYGKKFHGKETASGKTFNQNKLTAAHPTLPLGTKTKVTNLETGKSVEVEINDRGPSADGRAIDLSKRAARKIGIKKKDGTAKVKIEPAPQ